MADEFSGFPAGVLQVLPGAREKQFQAMVRAAQGRLRGPCAGPGAPLCLRHGRKAGAALSRHPCRSPGGQVHIQDIPRRALQRDKRPFKTNLGIWFWEGSGKRMESSGYYVMLEPGSIMLGVGMYMFPKEFLKEYRDSVVHPRYGAAARPRGAGHPEKRGLRAGRGVLQKGPPRVSGRS